MAFKIEFSQTAKDELSEIHAWLITQSGSKAIADAWYRGLKARALTLRQNPRRCRPAPESAFFSEEIRQLLHGKRHGIYRILFEIRGRTVHVLHIRHGAREPLKPDEE